MDKKDKKRSVIKRKSEQESPPEEKKPKVITMKVEESKMQVQVVNQVENQVELSQQIVHAGQIVEGNFEQPVFVNMKGEPVQLGPNTVIVYEQSGNASNFAVGGMWTMDSSGRLVMGDTVYDVKGEPDEDNQTTYVQNTNEVTTVSGGGNQYQQYELTPAGTNVDGDQEYEVSILEKPSEDNDRQSDTIVQVSSEEELAALGQQAVQWLNKKYEFVIRKLQLNYDAGVKLLHSQTGCIQCVYFTTPAMQVAFNAVPQFLCIETSIQYMSLITGMNGNASVMHYVTVFLAEDGNGRSVIVSAGMSPFQHSLQWLLDTFKSCNPAYKQVRCIVAEPLKFSDEIREAFPGVHLSCTLWQAANWACRASAGRLKTLAYGILHQQSLVGLKKQLSPAVVSNLESVLEPENYTNILHKGLERLMGRLSSLTRTSLQPEEFITGFFSTVEQMETERRNFAILKLRETEGQKHSPTDTITQYAYNLMSHQTKLAQKCLDDKGGKRHSSAAICKYGTSTQECSCLFSKVFRLPCRHILMLTTELKVKTHIPFEPRWTVQHCLFGNESTQAQTAVTQGAPPQAQQQYIEQIVVEENDHRVLQSSNAQAGVRPQQYVIAAPSSGQNVPQVIFCSPSTAVQGTVLQAAISHTDSH